MISTTGIQVHDEDEAEILMVHHLLIAASLFEATHDDDGEEAIKLIAKLPDGFREASQAFVTSLVNYYKGIDL